MKAHRTDPLSLAFGMLFLLVASGFAANRWLDVTLPDMGIFIAAGVALLGGVIAITALFPHRKPAAVEPQETQETQEPVEVDEDR